MTRSHVVTKLAQLRANKSLLLQSCLHMVNSDAYTLQYLLCLRHTHDTIHLFNCSQVSTPHYPTSLFKLKNIDLYHSIQIFPRNCYTQSVYQTFND